MNQTPPLEQIIKSLEAFYGPPTSPQVTGPLEMILWENVAYLVDDQTRKAAYNLLEQRLGINTQAILDASNETLLEIAKAGGMLPENRVDKLRTIATLVLSDFEGDLNQNLKGSVSQMKKALQKFPGIGEPGAEKILLFSRRQAALALESNGLRVLLRLGFGEEKKSYPATYRSVQEAVKEEIQQDFDWLIETHLLLRQHGQELCKRATPLCEACPIKPSCRYYQTISV